MPCFYKINENFPKINRNIYLQYSTVYVTCLQVFAWKELALVSSIIEWDIKVGVVDMTVLRQKHYFLSMAI